MNVEDLREAIAIAREDRDECLRFFRPVVRRTCQLPMIEQYARLEASVHELDLLRKLEMNLIEHGKEVAA